MRELGTDWLEIAACVGSKTAAECKRFYRTERQNLSLDDFIAEYHTNKASVTSVSYMCVMVLVVVVLTSC